MSRAAGAVQEWFSAAELAELALPGLPTTKRGILDLAVREGWLPANCGTSRRRKGRGGGTEFHVSLVLALGRKKIERAEQILDEAVALRAAVREAMCSGAK